VVVALGHRQVAREAAVGEIAAREAAVVVVHGCLQLDLLGMLICEILLIYQSATGVNYSGK
jgi:hypothetical protein